jgi:hypothetical protein
MTEYDDYFSAGGTSGPGDQGEPFGASAMEVLERESHVNSTDEDSESQSMPYNDGVDDNYDPSGSVYDQFQLGAATPEYRSPDMPLGRGGDDSNV